MQSSDHVRDLTVEEGNLPDLAGLLAKFREEVVAEPEELEGALRGIATGVRERLGLGAVDISVSVGESLRFSILEGSAVAGREMFEEFAIRRGKLSVGAARGYPAGSKRRGYRDHGKLVAGWREELRAVAAVAALALDAAHARGLATQRAAHGSVVQIASEAMGTILNERELYKTVLVLTLELLDASGGAVLVEGGDVVSLGLDGSGEVLAALEAVRLKGRVPWIGRIGQRHALGVGFGSADGAIFLVREKRPYTEAEGASLRLVARQLARAQERSRLYASLEKTTLEAISALAAALESRDGTTGGHIKRTQILAGKVARTMGLSTEEIRAAQYAAVLHDIGKIGIPDLILNKPTRLTENEWEIMRRHPKMGAEIVGKISGFDSIIGAVLSHHERYDGRGYPKRLAGAEMPTGARLISVIDAYDAMTNDRPYRKALTREEAMAELEANSGSQFNPEVVEALKAVLLKREEHELEREKEPDN